MPVAIEQVIAQIPSWVGRSLTIATLGGGLTNRNYRVDVDGESFVARIPGESTELLAIDRANEYHNARAAAAAGLCPRIAHHLPDADVMVLEFIRGETMTIASLRRPNMPTRIAQALKQLHAGPRFLHDFNMFRLVERYLQIAEQHAIRIPDGFHGYLPKIAQIEKAFARRPLPSVPCHNDLVAGNVLDDGRQLWLIDFEYSGNNDPSFELGNACQEQQYGEPRIVELCAAYFGAANPDRLARMKLNMIMSDIGWSLWGAIQATISAIDFDFWNYATERWDRGTTKLDSPELNVWLRDIAQ